MDSPPKYVDWSRGTAIRKVVGSDLRRNSVASVKPAGSTTAGPRSAAPAGLSKAVDAAHAAIRNLEDAKRRGNPSEIAARRCDLAVAKAALEGERKLAVALDAMAHAPQFKFGW